MFKRAFAGTVVAAALAAALAAPASAGDDAAAGSISVPAAGGCDKEYTIWWDTGKTPPAGSYGYVAC